jgi:hypothetical protein
VIRMRAERIEVEFGILYSKVDAHFVFRSTKPDAPARQLVGFPDLSATAENDSSELPRNYMSIRYEFAIWRDEESGAQLQRFARFIQDGNQGDGWTCRCSKFLYIEHDDTLLRLSGR